MKRSAAEFTTRPAPWFVVLAEALVSSLLWAVVFCAAWFWPQRASFAQFDWLSLTGMLLALWIALTPAVFLTGLLLRRDFRRVCTSYRYVGFARRVAFDARRYPRSAELAFWTLLLFPLYPLVRWLCRRSATSLYWSLMLLAAALIGTATCSCLGFDEPVSAELWPGDVSHRPRSVWEMFLPVLAVTLVYLCTRRLLRRCGHLVRPHQLP